MSLYYPPLDYPPLAVIATPDLHEYQTTYHQYREEFVTIGLLGGMYGVLTTLSIISIYTLLNQPSERTRRTSVLLCLTILTFFTSTTVYVVICFVVYLSNLMVDMASSALFLWNIQPPISFPAEGIVPYSYSQSLAMMQSCASSASLTINVTLGDTIVCWRACVVWHKNCVVKTICVVLLLITFILGSVDTIQTCHHPSTVAYVGLNAQFRGGLFEGLPVGIATCVLSLSTNSFATVLVGIKAWQSRRSLKGYLVEKVGGSRVEKLLTLLIESGAIYSAIWLGIAIFQIIGYLYMFDLSYAYGSPGLLNQRFVNYFGVTLNGVLIPGIAIYPTIIIVLVALNRSHIEKGISQHLETMATPHLSIAVDMTNTNLPDRQARIGLPEESDCGSSQDLEDDSERRCVDEPGRRQKRRTDADQLPLDP